MSELHLEGWSDSELVELVDEAMGSLNARFEQPDYGDVSEDQPAEAIAVQVERVDALSDTITQACDAWDRFAGRFRQEA